MGETTIAKLLVRIGADASAFASGLKGAEKTLQKASANMQSIGRSMSVGLTVPLLAASGAALKFAADAVESENLFEVSMGNMAGAARKWSDDLAAALGLNAYALRESVGGWQVLLTNMGLGEKAAFDMGRRLVELANDMASFYNMSGGAAEASEKLRSIMAGEAEVARRLGIDVSAAAVKTAAYTEGIAKQGTELSEAQKILARYSIVLRQTATAQGDLARTLDSPVNQVRLLQEQAKQAAIQFGQALLPVVKELMPTINDMATAARTAAAAFAQLDPETRKAAIGIAATVAAAGPLLQIGGATAAGVAKLAGAVRQLAGNGQIASAVLVQLAGSSAKTSSASLQVAAAMRTAAAAALTLKAAAAGAVAVLSYEATDSILQATGAHEKLREVLGLSADQHKEWVAEMEGSKDKYLEQLTLYNALREKLGLLGEEYRVTADNTRANAERLAVLLPRAQALHKTLIDQNIAQQQANKSSTDAAVIAEKIRAAVQRQDAAIRSIIEATKAAYGIMLRKDVEDQVGELIADFELMNQLGASGEQLYAGFGARVRELAGAASGYTDLNLPWEFNALADAVDRGQQGVTDYAVLMKRAVPDAAATAARALEGSVVGAMERTRNSVAEDIQGMRQDIDALTSGNYTIDVRAKLNVEDLKRQLRDANLKPDTGGSVSW